MKTLFPILLLLCFASLHAQTKQEKETRIKVGDLPTIVQETITPFLAQAHKIRYYQETDGDHQSYEVKFALKGKQYSVEFEREGALEDVEVVVPFKNIPPVPKQAIRGYFQAFEKYKLRRVQKQYSSAIEDANTTIQNAIDGSDEVSIRYEIVADLKTEGHWEIREFLFDDEGQLLSSRKVVKRSQDFILY